MKTFVVIMLACCAICVAGESFPLPEWDEGDDEHIREHIFMFSAAIFPEDVIIEIEREWMLLMQEEEKANDQRREDTNYEDPGG